MSEKTKSKTKDGETYQEWRKIVGNQKNDKGLALFVNLNTLIKATELSQQKIKHLH